MMNKKLRYLVSVMVIGTLMTGVLTGCSSTSSTSNSTESTTSKSESGSSSSSNTAKASSTSKVDTSELFTDRDLEQNADTSGAKKYTVADNEDITITEEGVYVISGSAKDCSIIVDAEDQKVQIVLNGVTITNSDKAAIYVKQADKVFVTTYSGSENTLTTTGTFTADSENNVDAVIYSKDDVVLNGTGSLTIKSSANGISSKDGIKITGGNYNITSTKDALEANDYIAVCDGDITINSSKDALHTENSDDDSLGFVYISGGTLNIKASSDGLQGNAYVQIDGGNITINSSEGIEGTFVQINDGTISIDASDDGINATSKSSSYSVGIEINGGDLTINMGQGDTDALDANGSLIVNGGNINITAQFAFDFDTESQFNGGTITVNGEEVTEITESMQMGGGGRGGMGGMQGDMPQDNGNFQRGNRGGFR
ncbi:MAG: carbohydrate-binding domain-containing protein [Lachnospiraceae bacterium]|nr:carbohydrate-binding domain-containing protein [Lachnospiraceae bacterium]